jgi:hypothetical protein
MIKRRAFLRKEMNENVTALQRQVSNLQQEMVDLRQETVDLRQEINKNSAAYKNSFTQLSIQTARHVNRSLVHYDTIFPVLNDHGDLPPHDLFPRYQNDIAKMTLSKIEALLKFYGLRWPQKAILRDKKRLLSDHLGLAHSY